MNRRRELLLALGLGALAAPSRALAQPAGRLRRIGVLSVGSSATDVVQQFQRRLREQLLQAGYEEGRNLAIEWRFARGDVARLDGLANELVGLNVEVIVAGTNDAIAAAKRATRTIPIVMYGAVLPVELGFIESLARPGGNITGTTWSAPEMTGKLLEILKEAAPRTARIAVLLNPTLPGMALSQPAAGRAARELGISMEAFPVTRPEDIAAALDLIGASRPDALLVAADSIVGSRIREIAAFALRQKLLSMGTIPQFVNEGGALYYGVDIWHLFQRMISHVDRILKGAKPAELPVEQPSKFELVINLKTAKALGLTIPQSLLLRADEVIE